MIRLSYLEEQYEWHPLVIADKLSVLCDVKPFLWNRLFDRQIVRVADPADGIRVVAVAVSELGWTPAVDWSSDKLLRADEEPETDEDDDSVLSTQSVDIVIVHTKLQLANTEHRLEHAIHLVYQMYTTV